jgi:hypothetical protein
MLQGAAVGIRRLEKCYEEARKLAPSDPGAPLPPEEARKLDRVLDCVKLELVSMTAGRILPVARRWIRVFEEQLAKTSETLGARGWTLSKELKSFVTDPRLHLKKKLFNYAYDLARGKIGLNEYLSKGSAALTTSLRTNLRTIYQDWVLLAVLEHLGRRGGVLIYPEHRVLGLERSGRQRAGTIPPNAAVSLPRGELSFFLEAPRPLGWEDTSDLRRYWKLYVTLRPDIMVYGGMVDNMVLPGDTPGIRRPDVIIECKELSDWYRRSRDLRGPFAEPISAEEWRARWIEGLWTGLADILGVEKRYGGTEDRRRSVRVREPRLVILYKEFYKPRSMILVSRARSPRSVKAFLEEHGVMVVDGVGFDAGRLEGVADLLETYARRTLPPRSVLEAWVRRVVEELGVSENRVVEAVIHLLDKHRGELVKLLKA